MTDLLHCHERVRQLYFLLEGEATVEIDRQTIALSPRQALQIEPDTPHRIANRSRRPIEFS